MFSFEDLATNYRLTLRNGVLVYRKVPADELDGRSHSQTGFQGPVADARER